MWSPFAQSFDIFAHRIEHTGFNSAPSHDAWKIDLPGGGFIEKPGSESQSPNDVHDINCDEFSTPEERQSLFAELDKLLSERSTRELEIQDLVGREMSLQQSLNKVHASLDIHAKELTDLRETLRARREELQITFSSSNSAVQNLRNNLEKLRSEDAQLSEHRALAAESSALRTQIAHGGKERRALQEKVDELNKVADSLEIKCRTVRMEEKILDQAIRVHVQSLAENGCLSDGDNNKITVLADIHRPPSKPPQSLASGRVGINSRRLTVVSLANIKAFQKLAEEITVLDDEGAVEEVARNKNGFVSTVKRLFGKRFKRLARTGKRVDQTDFIDSTTCGKIGKDNCSRKGYEKSLPLSTPLHCLSEF